MVAFRARSKWKRGWRRLRHDGTTSAGSTADEDAFTFYWLFIQARLNSPEWPLPSPSRPISILGGIFGEVRQPLFVLAPMVLQSERAFRLLVQRYGVKLCFSPMLLARNVLNHAETGKVECPYARELLRPCPQDKPVMAQLAGADPQLILAAARRLWEGGNIAGIDLNFGCPQKCAEIGMYGAYLVQKDSDTAVAMVRILVKELGVPVSCKLRCIGGVEATVSFAQRLEEAGAALLTVHGRTPHQRDHQAISDFDVIRAVREAVSIPVLANGNCRTRQDAECALRYTGCDGMMSAVGLLRNPRLFAAPADTIAPADAALTSSGTLTNPRVAFACAWEYLELAEAFPPPEPRCVRDHLQVILQGVLQFKEVALWNLLGSDRMVLNKQFRELLRLGAVLCASRSEEGMRVGKEGEGGVLTLQEIKSLHRRGDKNEEEQQEGDGKGFVWGGLFEEEGEEENEEKEEKEEKDDPKDENLVYALEVQVPWSRRLLDGSKTVETRGYDLPLHLWGHPILLLESPAGGGLAKHGRDAGKTVGVVVFGRSKRYRSRAEWVDDADKHGVDPQAGREEFGWCEHKTKWGWEVDNLEVWGEEQRRGVSLREEQRIVGSIFCLGEEGGKREIDADLQVDIMAPKGDQGVVM